jgi:CSLREA domain-containing protein
VLALLAGALVVGAQMIAGPAHATEWAVTSPLDGVDASPGDGQCATASMDCTLRAAIQEANATAGSDRILLPGGTFTLTLAGPGEDDCATGDLDIYDSLELVGIGSDRTTIDAGGLDRVLHLHNNIGASQPPTMTISGMTLTGGTATTADGYRGGGVFAEGLSQASFDDVRIIGNAANQGGGLHVVGGMLMLERSSILDNQLVDIGITNLHGSGIYISSATVGAWAVTVAGNSGALSASGSVHVHGSTWATFTDSTFANDASARGVRSYNTNLELIRCTITGNAYSGLSYGSYDGTNYLTLAGTILAGNGGLGLSGCYISSGIVTHAYNIETGDTCGFSAANGDLINTDPILGPLADNGGLTQSRLPQTGSPAIDLIPASSAYCGGHDQRGTLRPTDDDSNGQAACEAGSVEIGLLFTDGLETGDMTQWSSTAP